MKKSILVFVLWFASGSVFASPALQEGDLVFLSEEGDFARAIQLATHSPYNHVGMVFIRNGKPYVFEAVGPVKFTPLENFAKRGIQGRCTAKRLKNAGRVLTPEVFKKMEALVRQFKGRRYDWTFGLTDQKMYCSELVWKMYKRSAGLEIGRYQRLKDLDLSHPLVQSQLKEKFGGFFPLELKLVSPAQVFGSDLLEEVKEEAP
jgi:hypothetical protein